MATISNESKVVKADKLKGVQSFSVRKEVVKIRILIKTKKRTQNDKTNF